MGKTMESSSPRNDDFGDRLARASSWAACVVAVLVIGAGAGVRFALDPYLGQKATFLFFIPPVVVAAAMAGLWPGLFAAALGAGAGLAMDHLTGGIDEGSIVGAVAYIMIGVIVTIGGEWFQRAR